MFTKVSTTFVTNRVTKAIPIYQYYSTNYCILLKLGYYTVRTVVESLHINVTQLQENPVKPATKGPEKSAPINYSVVFKIFFK